MTIGRMCIKKCSTMATTVTIAHTPQLEWSYNVLGNIMLVA